MYVCFIYIYVCVYVCVFVRYFIFIENFKGILRDDVNSYVAPSLSVDRCNGKMEYF